MGKKTKSEATESAKKMKYEPTEPEPKKKGTTKKAKQEKRREAIEEGTYTPPPAKKKKGRAASPAVAAEVPDTATPPTVPETRFSMDELVTVLVPIESLHPNPDNPNSQDDREFGELVRSVEELGFTDAIQVFPITDPKDPRYQPAGTWSKPDQEGIKDNYGSKGWAVMKQYGPTQQYEIVAGQHRWEALKVRREKLVPVVINPHLKDKDQRDFALVRHNIVKGELDPQKFTRIYERVVAKFGAEKLAGAMGFIDREAMQSYVVEVEAAMEGMPDSAKKEFKAKAKGVKTIEDLSRIVNTIFTKYGSTLEYGFCFFEFGGQTQCIIYLDKAVKTLLDEITSFTAENDLQVNDVMKHVLSRGWDKTVPDLVKAEQATKGDDEDEDDGLEDDEEESAFDEDEEEDDDEE